jgi:hypothetical protein
MEEPEKEEAAVAVVIAIAAVLGAEQEKHCNSFEKRKMQQIGQERKLQVSERAY